MLQMLLSEWIVRIFLLYLVVVSGVALIRHQQQAVSRPFFFSPVSDVHERWAALASENATSRAMWWGKYLTRDKSGIRIGNRKRGSGEFRRDGDRMGYA